MNAPYFTDTSADASVTIAPVASLTSATASFKTHTLSLKSTPPVSIPIKGITMPSTKEVTIFPNEAPITKATAISTRLPRMANSLNSFSIPMVELFW